MRVQLNLVIGFSAAIGNWAKASLEASTFMVSYRLGCLPAVADAGCTQRPLVVGELGSRDVRQFK
jgi:hypothetical protein